MLGTAVVPTLAANAGDWSARHGGSVFHREWFKYVDVLPHGLRLMRFWDLATTEAKPGTDPGWTAGVLMGQASNGNYQVEKKVNHAVAGNRRVMVTLVPAYHCQ